MKVSVHFSLLILCGCVLCGCAAENGVSRPVSVEIPVRVPCAVAPVYPPLSPVETLSSSASFAEGVRALIVENELRKAYEIRLVAALSACAE